MPSLGEIICFLLWLPFGIFVLVGFVVILMRPHDPQPTGQPRFTHAPIVFAPKRRGCLLLRGEVMKKKETTAGAARRLLARLESNPYEPGAADAVVELTGSPKEKEM